MQERLGGEEDRVIRPINETSVTSVTERRAQSNRNMSVGKRDAKPQRKGKCDGRCETIGFDGRLNKRDGRTE
jgi:hypothetical protein